MAKYTSEKYPSLSVYVGGDVGYAHFTDGEYETTDKQVMDVLDNLPDDDGVAKASAAGRSKQSDDK